MLKKLIFYFTLIIAFVLSPQFVFSQKVSPAPSVSPAPEVINFYEAFWPLTAGKTIDDPLYFLKSLKENLRGMLIFGSAEKANYQIFLATKRVLEAESLIKQDKKDVAEKTLDKATIKLQEASVNFDKAKENGSVGNYSDSIIRLENVRTLINVVILQENEDSVKSKLNDVSLQAEALHKKITQ